MGAQEFTCSGKGVNAEAAFLDACDTARYEYGHGGYTGSIAEKNSFVMIDVPKGENPRAFVEKLLLDWDSRISDKWGPAGCVALGEGEYLFFGNASS